MFKNDLIRNYISRYAKIAYLFFYKMANSLLIFLIKNDKI